MRVAIRFAIAASILVILLYINGALHLLPVVGQKVRDLKHEIRLSSESATDDNILGPSIGTDQSVVVASHHDDEGTSPASISETHSTASVVIHSSTKAQVSSVPKQIERMVVIGRSDGEDASWVQKLSNWQNSIYEVQNRTSPLHTTTNKGREANVYLTYILDNYDNLPSVIAFVHSHEKGFPKAWHTDAEDYSNVNSLETLNIDFVRRNGYANLRCIAIPGCPDEIQPFREPFDEGRTAEHAFAEVWKYLFENDNVPNTVATPCCAQFAVSKEQVLERPRKFYVRAHQWLQSTPLDDDTSGRVYEYMWHIIFGQEPVYCPELQQCWIDVYNRES